MQKLTNKQNWFKQKKLTSQDELYIGLDVHRKSIAVAFWLNGRVELTFNTSADYNRLTQQLLPLKQAVKLIVYEAGPTGYALARRLAQAQLPVEVIAPANTPRPSKKQSKTDYLDSGKLAEYAAKGLLKPVTIPTEQQETERQLNRVRDQLVGKRRRVRQQIKSFLLQHGIAQPPSLAAWTLVGVHELRQLKLNSALRFTLDMYLEELDHLTDQIKRTEAQLRQLAGQEHHKRAVRILTSHPGVGMVTALAFRLEFYRPERFDQGVEIASFIGLSPRISQSGQSCREGPIVKTGRRQLRSKLIEAAWIWIRYDGDARRVYGRLVSNTANTNKAIVAMARRLAVRLWTMLCTDQLYRRAAG